MEAALFTKMLSDKSVLDLKKLGYKFPQADIGEFVGLLKNGFYHSLPLKDFSGQDVVYLPSIAQVHLSAAKVLLTPQNSMQLYGVKAMEEERTNIIHCLFPSVIHVVSIIRKNVTPKIRNALL